MKFYFFHVFFISVLIFLSGILFGQEKLNPNGYNIFYNDNKTKVSEGILKNGKPDGYWKSLENTISEAKEVMKEQGVDKLPPGNKLVELGYNSLSSAISRHHVGFPNFRELLNQELGIKSNKEHLTEVWKKYTGK